MKLLVPLLIVCYSTVSYAAPVCDGVTDDRVEIQALLDSSAGHEVALPPGICLVSAAPLRNYALWMWPRTTLRGAGQSTTTLILAGGSPLSTQLLWVENAPGVTIQDITLDGNKALQSPPGGAGPQRHGVFLKNSPYAVLRKVSAQNLAGDGFYIYAGSDFASLIGVTASDNQRDGVTLGGAVSGTTTSGSSYLRNGQDGWHSEGGGNNNMVSISGSMFDGNAGYAITMSGVGADPSVHNYKWTVTDNVVNGPVAIVWVDDVLYARNLGTNGSLVPSVFIYRQTQRVRVEDNVLTATGTATLATSDGISLISVLGTNSDQSPRDIVIRGNTLTTVHPQFGIAVVSATDATIESNVLVGSSEGVGIHSSGVAGILVRPIRVDNPTKSIVISRNSISGFGSYGVMFAGNGGAQILKAEITNNVFSGVSQLFSLSLDDGLHEAVDVTQAGNTTETLMVTHAPAGVPMVWGDGTRWVMP